MSSLPNAPRIVVVGTSAVGKSTFARALAAKVRPTYIELDELHWAPAWREKATREFAQLVDVATKGQSWVVDGNYGVIRDLMWPRANPEFAALRASSTYPHLTWVEFRRPADAQKWLADIDAP